jgi:hypothetical protein
MLFYLQTQQTPKPEAHVPELDPPIKIKIFKFSKKIQNNIRCPKIASRFQWIELEWQKLKPSSYFLWPM